MGSLFPLPRVLYSMASDGLLCPIFAHVSTKSRTPIYSTLIGGFIAALMALIFDLLTLVEMLSIGTLIAYTQVALAVLISRYETVDTTSLNCNLFSMIIILLVLCFISLYSFEQNDSINPFSLIIFTCLLLLLIYLINTQFLSRKQNISDDVEHVFLAPCVPWLPVFSIFCNIYLMLKLSFITWIRFFLWMIIGLTIYFLYGIHQAGRILLSTMLVS